jgi:hypothetical protein
MRRTRTFLSVFLATALAASALAPAAAAQASGECGFTIAGQSSLGGTVSVNDDATVEVTGDALPNSTTEIFLNFFRSRWSIAKPSAGSGGDWSQTINVKDYAKWGVGRYLVDWRGAAASDGRTVTCQADVKIQGSFLGSRIGWAATALLAVSAAGLLLTVSSALQFSRSKNAKWEAKAHAKAKVERDETTGKYRVKMLGKSISQTAFSTAWGILASGGSVAALVGTGVSPPTISLAASVAIPFALVGFFAGQLKVHAMKAAALRHALRGEAPPPEPELAAA